MLLQEVLNKPVVWLTITLVCLLLTTFLPIWVKDYSLRQKVNLFLLVPVSLIIILYVYPIGIEFFKRLALSF